MLRRLMGEATRLFHCEAHGALAGWECTSCHQPLCPDCAATKVVPPISLVVCARCGELAEPLLRPRAESQTFVSRIPSAFIFPLKGEGPAVWLGLAMVLWLLHFAGGLGTFLAWCILIGSLFGLVRSTARGGDGIELSDFSSPLDGVLVPVARFGVAMLPAWGGAILVGSLGQPALWWVVLAVVVAWTPTSLIAAASGANLVDLLNPVRVLGASARIGKDFGVYVVALIGALLLWVVLLAVGAMVNALPIPFITSAIASLLAVYPALVVARLAGTVMHVHGTIFGMEALQVHDPVLGDTQPRGQPPVKERTLPRHLPNAIELEPSPEPVMPQAYSRFEAVESAKDAPLPQSAPLDVALLPSHGEQSATSIRAAMRAGNADAALDGFRATGLMSAEHLSVDELLWLGQTAGARIDYESSLLALEHAARRDAPPESKGRAWVMLGRLLGEHLNRRDEATVWMQRVVNETPGTAAARFATRWLSA
ncbi:MAG: hypothetical protein DI536_15080 [Archangium gephyra]|uniref:B box-type domain-containing protein n=1 Tax=Archangium gephyra TaxID=48 RepID=A0A2W5VP95_9BACT|nr:MAG: hypothetical protein DI536_15080 [Archangium gephyra]